MALTTAQIQNAYVAFFNRPADVAGLNYWSTYAGSTADLLNTFAQSSEYKALYSGLNHTQMVNAVYQNLFGHAPDVAGLSYWVTQLDNGKLAIGSIADAINKGAQGTDATIISNKVTAASAFTAALDTTAEILAYAGVNSSGLQAVKDWLNTVTSDTASVTTATGAALTTVLTTVQSNVASTGSTFTLTKSVQVTEGTSGSDTIISGDDGGTATLNAGDVINGGAGTDTLKIFNAAAVTNGANFTTATISGVENVEFTSAATTQALDVSGNADVTKVTLVNGLDAVVTAKLAQTVGLKGNINTNAAATASCSLRLPALLTRLTSCWTVLALPQVQPIMACPCKTLKP